jgi:hypothetical protein
MELHALAQVLLALSGGFCGQMYMKTQLPVRRYMSVAQAPVLGHVTTSIANMGESRTACGGPTHGEPLTMHTLSVSIRAYGSVEACRAEGMRLIDCYTRAARTFYNLNR